LRRLPIIYSTTLGAKYGGNSFVPGHSKPADAVTVALHIRNFGFHRSIHLDSLESLSFFCSAAYLRASSPTPTGRKLPGLQASSRSQRSGSGQKRGRQKVSQCAESSDWSPLETQFHVGCSSPALDSLESRSSGDASGVAGVWRKGGCSVGPKLYTESFTLNFCTAP
jgi:hypothetical protein